MKIHLHVNFLSSYLPLVNFKTNLQKYLLFPCGFKQKREETFTIHLKQNKFHEQLFVEWLKCYSSHITKTKKISHKTV